MSVPLKLTRELRAFVLDRDPGDVMDLLVDIQVAAYDRASAEYDRGYDPESDWWNILGGELEAVNATVADELPVEGA